MSSFTDQYFTFETKSEHSPNGRRDILIDVPREYAPDIYILDQDESICCSVDTKVHYSFVIFIGAIAYAAGFLTCLYVLLRHSD